jgi:ketosteroid isomerase-like protein
MKRVLLITIAIVFTTQLYAQEQSTKNQDAVQQVVVKMFEALSNRDSAGLKMYCAQNILLFENGQVWNMDTLIIKAILLNTTSDYKRTNSFEFLNTEVNNNTAWVSYDLRSDITRNSKQGSAHWMETVVLIKEKNQWKIKLLHSTLIKRN